jgi:hypothetical protein
MTAPSVTNTLTNGTVIDAAALNTNFTDIINTLTDGSKTFSIDALTCAGATTLNGAVSLGNATGDDIAVTGYLTGALIPKTTNLMDLGLTGQRFKDLWLSGTMAVAGVATFAGVPVANDGIKLDNDAAAGGLTALNYYREEDLSAVGWMPSGAGSAVSAGFAVKITRIGRVVNLYFPASISAVAASSSGSVALKLQDGVTAVTLPAFARPTGALELACIICNSGTEEAGDMVITTGGSVALYRAAGVAAFSNNVAGVYGACVTYIV